MRINVGSGQRPFVGKDWVNLDCQEKWRKPTEEAGGKFQLGSILDIREPNERIDMIVMHHVLEHLHLNEAKEWIKRAHDLLEPGGQLLVFVPNIRELATRWLRNEIGLDEFRMHIYGPYAGDIADLHKTCWDGQGMRKFLMECAPWSYVSRFGDEKIEGADIAAWDWWILDFKAVK